MDKRVGRLGRVILHSKKRGHGRDFGDFERKWPIVFLVRYEKGCLLRAALSSRDIGY